MTRYFTHYWANKTWVWNNISEGNPLDHCSGNLFKKRKLQLGDIIYVVTVLKGKLYLCGKMKVEKICGLEEAAEFIGANPNELWRAPEHVVASEATPMNFNLRLPYETTSALRFVTNEGEKPLVFSKSRYLDQQTLRGVRELTIDSAKLLNIWLPNFRKIDSHRSNGDNQEHNIIPEEVHDPKLFFEGALINISVNRYERDIKARKVCISKYGARCFVCNFSFEKFYGLIGKDYIHIHHLIPLSKIGKEYVINPVDDMRPLCPNCHAMIHKRNPPYTIRELKKIIRRSENQ